MCGDDVSRRDYLLLNSRRAPLAGGVIDELKKQGIKALPGAPINWRKSLENHVLEIYTEEPGVIGIFIQSDRFDELVDKMVG